MKPVDSASEPRPSLYRCPETRQPLLRRGDSLVTPDGAARYEVVEGVPQLLRFAPADPPAVAERLRTVNALARRRGWREALDQVYGDWRYMDPTRRSAWLELLPLRQDAVVLEIGASMGQFTPLLASRCRELQALEVVPGQAEFVAERCRQSGCENVEVACGGDDCRLPYRDQVFDLVVMNLVFEWCAGRASDAGGAAEGQRRMLAETHRVLRPGGSLYLLTKNRYALRLLLGGADEHAYGMRFGSALPRPLQHLLLRLRGRRRPQGLLHSHRALAGMLRAAGFAEARSYWAAPEMRYPRHCVPTDAASVRAARRRPDFVQGDSRRTRLLMPRVPADLVKHVTPGLLFLARKAG